MKRITFGLLAALVFVSACASTAPPPQQGHKFGAATTQIISANYDPSVSGLPGNVGDIVSVAGGATAWVKSGTGVTDWIAFPGGGGSGTVETIVAGSGVLVDDTDPGNPIVSSLGTDTILLRAQQLVPAGQFDTVLGTDFDNSAWFAATNGNNGTATMSKTTKGGVVTLASSATASGSSIITAIGAGSWTDNARTSPWYFTATFKVSTGNANTGLAVGLYAISGASVANPSFEVGYLGSISNANFSWHTTNGGGTNTDTGTGAALDTAWHQVEVYNDLTTITLLLDGAAMDTTLATNIGSSAMMFGAVAANGGTAANRTIDIDKVWFVTAGN